MADVRAFEDMFSTAQRNGVSYAAKERGSGVPMINMNEIFAYDRIADQRCELAPLTKQERRSFLLEAGDLLFARQSLTYEGAGKCVLVMPSAHDRTWESHIIRVRLDQAIASPAYFYYYFRSPQGRRSIEAIVHQVAAAGIRGSDLRRLAVPAIALSEQQRIAEVLGALDDKIAANQSFAELIDEYLAAQLELRRRETSDSYVPLGAIATVNGEVVRPVENGYLRYIDIASVGVGNYEFPVRVGWEAAPSRARRKVRKGDTLWSTVRPNRRSHALNLSADPLLVGSTGLAVISPRETGFAFLYEATKLPEFTAFLENSTSGTAYPAVRAERFNDAPVPALSSDSRDSFEEIAAPLRTSVAAGFDENRALAALRDTLLPHLMSGRLRVRDAEKIVSDRV